MKKTYKLEEEGFDDQEWVYYQYGEIKLSCVVSLEGKNELLGEILKIFTDYDPSILAINQGMLYTKREIYRNPKPNVPFDSLLDICIKNDFLDLEITSNSDKCKLKIDSDVNKESSFGRNKYSERSVRDEIIRRILKKRPVGGTVKILNNNLVFNFSRSISRWTLGDLMSIALDGKSKLLKQVVKKMVEEYCEDLDKSYKECYEE